MSVLAEGNLRRLRWRTARLGPAGTWAAAVLILIVALVILGPALVPHGPNETDLLNTNAAASPQHPFGTDSLGRDILSRVLVGARISLLGPLIVMVGSIILGTLVAVTAAWIGGRVDTVIGLVVDVAMAFPALLLAVLVAAFVGPGLWAPIIAITIANVPYIARLVRSAALAERSLPYIEALYVQGFRGMSVNLRHVIPNLAGLLAAIATTTFGYAMVDLAAISFLGLGVQPPTADWGSMVAEGQEGILEGHPQQALAAGALIVITVIAVNILGEALADRRGGRT